MGMEQVAATRPGTFVHHIAAAPDGTLLTLEFDDAMVVFDRQGQPHAIFHGRSQLWGWQPK